MSRLPSDPPLELGSEHRYRNRLHVTLLVSVSLSKFFVQQASPAIIFQQTRPFENGFEKGPKNGKIKLRGKTLFVSFRLFDRFGDDSAESQVLFGTGAPPPTSTPGHGAFGESVQDR